jgi:hypothetical protein
MARVPMVATGAPFVLALFEGAILADSITKRKRLTITGIFILLLRVLFDAFISTNNLNAILGVVGTGAGLLLGPMFDTTAEVSPPPPSSTHSSHSTLLPHTPKIKLKLPSHSSPGTRSSATVRPTRLFSPTSATSSFVNIPSEPSSAVSAASGTLPPIRVDVTHGGASASTTRGFHHEESESNHWVVDMPTPTVGSTPSAITQSGISGAYFERPPSPSPSPYPAHRESSLLSGPTAKERSKLLRALALSEDYKRRGALTQRQRMVEEGDFAWAFYLKHRAENAKGQMEEADREAARDIYDCELKYPLTDSIASDMFYLFSDYNPTGRREKNKIDVHGLTVREALKAADEALRDLQADGGTHLIVVTGKGKHSESGKPSIRPAMKEFFEE